MTLSNNRMDVLAGDNKQVVIEFYYDGELAATYDFDLNNMSPLRQADFRGMTGTLKARGAKQYNMYNTQNGGKVLVKSQAL